MKYFKILATLLLISVISFYSCNDNTKAAPKQETEKPVEAVKSPTITNTTTPTPATTEPAQNASDVWHYTCSIGCPGGAGSAVNCGNCGGVLAHNTAYHAKANNTQSSAPFASTAVTTPAATPAPEPSQNSAGVWHYTCGKGCAGGSGAAGNCGTCGGTLAHNTAYH